MIIASARWRGVARLHSHHHCPGQPGQDQLPSHRSDFDSSILFVKYLQSTQSHHVSQKHFETFTQAVVIPYICHFFYTDRIFENQILHPKQRLKSPKTLKMSLKKSYICIFFHSFWKNLHLTENFYTDMSVVSVTNKRYA